MRDLPNLIYLNVSGTQVGDKALQTIGGMSHLHDLYLQGTHVPDPGLIHLQILTHL